jgi:hypothetical protein
MQQILLSRLKLMVCIVGPTTEFRLTRLESGMHKCKVRVLGKKRWGKRFQSVSAGIAKVRSLRDPLIGLLAFLLSERRFYPTASAGAISVGVTFLDGNWVASDTEIPSL